MCLPHILSFCLFPCTHRKATFHSFPAPRWGCVTCSGQWGLAEVVCATSRPDPKPLLLPLIPSLFLSLPLSLSLSGGPDAEVLVEDVKGLRP